MTRLNADSLGLAKQGELLLLQSLFILLLKLSRNLLVSLVDSLLSILKISVPLLNILERLEDRILHLPLLLLHLLVQFRIQ